MLQRSTSIDENALSYLPSSRQHLKAVNELASQAKSSQP